MAKRRIAHPSPDSQALALQNLCELGTDVEMIPACRPAAESVLELTVQGFVQESVISLGAEHSVAGLTEYISSATFAGLSRFDLLQTAEVASIRRDISALFERLADAIATQKFVRWRMQKRPTRTVVSIAARRAAPTFGDLTELDPFFRNRLEAQAIRREQSLSRRARLPVYFERFGCLACKMFGRDYGACGCCKLCQGLLGNRLQHLDAVHLVSLDKPVPQAERWARYFTRHGCFCGERESHGACCLCASCYGEVCGRLQDIEKDLRLEAARG